MANSCCGVSLTTSLDTDQTFFLNYGGSIVHPGAVVHLNPSHLPAPHPLRLSQCLRLLVLAPFRSRFFDCFPPLEYNHFFVTSQYVKPFAAATPSLVACRSIPVCWCVASSRKFSISLFLWSIRPRNRCSLPPSLVSSLALPYYKGSITASCASSRTP